MKYHSDKSWPHPVLRPGQTDPDYPRYAFQGTASTPVVDDGGSIRFQVDFTLGHRELKAMIEGGEAQYALIIRSPRTHFRACRASQAPALDCEFARGELAGEVELTGFVTAANRLPDFKVDGWNSEYLSSSFDVESGGVLAICEVGSFWIEADQGGPLQSIFELDPSADVEPGRWNCDLRGDRVKLALHPDTFELMDRVRAHAKHDDGDAARLMNGIYLPALLFVLDTADRESSADGALEGLSDRRWYDALNATLAEAQLPLLGDGTDRAADAQALLLHPLNQLLETANAP